MRDGNHEDYDAGDNGEVEEDEDEDVDEEDEDEDEDDIEDPSEDIKVGRETLICAYRSLSFLTSGRP